MAKFSMKQDGKEVGPASVYAEPHGVAAEKTVVNDPTRQVAGDFKPGKPAARVSLGDPAADDVKTTGIKQRGAGAATKGFTSRGPMA